MPPKINTWSALSLRTTNKKKYNNGNLATIAEDTAGDVLPEVKSVTVTLAGMVQVVFKSLKVNNFDLMATLVTGWELSKMLTAHIVSTKQQR